MCELQYYINFTKWSNRSSSGDEQTFSFFVQLQNVYILECEFAYDTNRARRWALLTETNAFRGDFYRGYTFVLVEAPDDSWSCWYKVSY